MADGTPLIVPDFESIEAVASGSAARRTQIMALIGNLVFSWSNNESLFIHAIKILLNCDQLSATIVFSTLNTTRARTDLVQRLVKTKVTDAELVRELDRLVERFNRLTRIRNDFNHCLYTIDTHGDITHTHALRLHEVKGELRLGTVKPMDDRRLREMAKAAQDLKILNRDLWAALARLERAIAPAGTAR
jgi:hypothetical protein